MELQQHGDRQDDSEERAVAEIGHGPGDALDGLEPSEDEGDEAEEADPEDEDEDRGPSR